MNVYDFDDTILRGDSSARFFAYCFKHYPILWKDIPAQALNALLFALHIKKKLPFKQRMFGFLRLLPDPESAVSDFWKENLCRIKPFYRAQRKADDVVISASPEFLIRPACDALGIKCAMGSKVDIRTGRFDSPNCHDEEKVRRFREVFPEAKIDAFYSDSRSDDPLARLADRAYLVKGDTLTEW